MCLRLFLCVQQEALVLPRVPPLEERCGGPGLLGLVGGHLHRHPTVLNTSFVLSLARTTLKVT